MLFVGEFKDYFQFISATLKDDAWDTSFSGKKIII